MSKNHYHNYNAISNKKSDESSESIETKISVNDEEVENTKVETTVTTDVTEPESEPPKPVLAYVSGCVRLNIRKQPSLNSEIVGILNADDVVEIDHDESTDSFYKIVSPKAVGYCMKQYITIEE